MVDQDQSGQGLHCFIRPISPRIVEIQWLEHLYDHKNMFETGVVRANECYSQRMVRRHNRDIILIFFRMKVCCVFSLENRDMI